LKRGKTRSTKHLGTENKQHQPVTHTCVNVLAKRGMPSLSENRNPDWIRSKKKVTLGFKTPRGLLDLEKRNGRNLSRLSGAPRPQNWKSQKGVLISGRQPSERLPSGGGNRKRSGKEKGKKGDLPRVTVNFRSYERDSPLNRTLSEPDVAKKSLGGRDY